MPSKLLSNIPLSKKWLISWASILFGAFVLSISYVLFINPYHIIPGGVYGIGIILHHFFPEIQIGTFGLCLDIPLLIISFKVFGPKFGSKTIVVAVITPLLMNLFTTIIGDNPETMLGGHINLTNDVLLSAIFGGLTMGAGLGLIFKNHATSGGTDIVAMIVTKFFATPLSRSIVYIESVIVLIGLIVFGDWKLPLYSIITIFVYIKVIDYIIEGASNDKLIFVISDHYEKIRLFIIGDLERGGTYIKSTGMYTMKDKSMMFVVVSRRELGLVQEFIKEVDPDAFMVVVNAHETLGDGFKTFNDKIAS